MKLFPSELTEGMRGQDVMYRFTLDTACEFLFETTLQALDSTLAYPYITLRSGDRTSAREITPEEAFSQALFGVRTVLAGRLNMGERWLLQEFFKDKSQPYMEVITKFLNPILEEGLAKHATRAETGIPDDEGKTLLDSLLRETTGWTFQRLHHGPSH